MPKSENKKRKAKERAKKDTKYTTAQLNRIYIRDKGICQICMEPCSREDASRDHMTDLQFRPDGFRVKSDFAVQLAHKLCNNLRSNYPGSHIKGYGPQEPLVVTLSEVLGKLQVSPESA